MQIWYFFYKNPVQSPRHTVFLKRESYKILVIEFLKPAAGIHSPILLIPLNIPP